MSFSSLKISSKEIFYLPNVLTYLRLLSLPLIYNFLVKENLLAVGLLTLLGISTDIFDGILARKFNKASNLGKILDPLVDKIAIGIFAIYAVIYKDFPFWAACFVILKDLLILVAGLVALNKFKEFPVSNLWGKLTAMAWALTILSYILNLKSIKEILLVAGLTLTLFSSISYLKKFLLQLKINKL
ncbi:MAG: CDP-diacylglycerol-glycerol-3-phosphate 3-phosphatidyltransferase [candidate division Zixibacteria bacterium RBG-1]|nr:MAG: CDP-diacylglycerol-glycerol-3-phosphate 3-phosphatidyltransferase [candidate division Zixibacteria bacterium RBG-1]OGC86518.1 MAG: hypothetical protein A2V73_05100 [candidate division Zixibacteria bacterium RBG_19FT_COMBO_42_43]